MKTKSSGHREIFSINIFKATVAALVIGIILSPFLSYGQDMGIYKGNSAWFSVYSPPSLTNLQINPAISLFTPPTCVKKGAVKISTSFNGADYIYGKDPANIFNVTFTFTVQYKKNTNLVRFDNVSFTLDNNHPEGLFYKNLETAISAQCTLDIDEVNITNISGLTYSLTPNMQGVINSSLQLKIEYEIEYAINPGGSNINFLLQPGPLANNSKVIHFSWNEINNHVYPNYQVQLLRLFNESMGTITLVDNITTTIDWSKALTFETESSNTFIDLTIGEGTGYYVWRVRPLGTYEGGLNNPANLTGNWTTDEPASPASLNPTVLASNSNYNHSILFFEDPDDPSDLLQPGINFIYSRTFTEGAKTGEQITYANGLQQVKQTQVYLPSKDKRIVTQTLQDKTGRPAITTLPVPVDNKFDGYKKQLVLNGTGLYRADDFDMDPNYNNPPSVNDAATPFKYYSNNNSTDAKSEQIPNAEGFPFTRTIYENDGSARVKEQSGVGIMQMMGTTNGAGNKTIKTFFDTPAQEELNMLFGDEAPLSGNVFRKTVVDQNGTSSVTFTNKEGKVIATGLDFTVADGLDPLATTPSVQTAIHDIVTTNVAVDGGFASTKKITVRGTTAMPCSLSYSITCQQIQMLCGNLNLDCGYSLIFYIHNLDNGTTVTEPSTGIPVPITCPFTYTAGISLNPGNNIIEKRIVKSGQPQAQFDDAEDQVNVQIRPVTGWIKNTLAQVDCDEELYTFYSDLFYLASVFPPEVPGPYTGPLPWDISFPSGEHLIFPQNTNPVLDYVTIFNAHPGEFEINLYDNSSVLIPLTPLPTAPTVIPAYAVIKTPCCSLVVSVKYTPPYKCPGAGALITRKGLIDNGTIPLNTLQINESLLTTANGSGDYYLPDFEGYAISLLQECGMSPTDAHNKFYEQMVGWHKPGMFNLMVYHMLTDLYNTKGLGIDVCGSTCTIGTNTSGSAATPGYGSDCASGVDEQVSCTQYKCSELAKCWTNLVMAYAQSICPGLELDLSGAQASGGVSKKFDEQKDDPDGGIHDDFVDDNFHIPKFLKWILKAIIHPKLRRKQNIGEQNTSSQYGIPPPSFNLNLVEAFLACTGYQFADIIDHLDLSYPINSLETRSTGNPFSSNNCFLTLDNDFDANQQNGEYDPDYFFNNTTFPPSPISPFTTVTDYTLWSNLASSSQTGARTLGKIFPNIHNPIYAFKYFEYDYGSQPELEINTCFRDPNDCNGTPCCTGGPCFFCNVGYVNCTSTKPNWNSGQRYTYFVMTKSYNGRGPSETSMFCPLLNCQDMTTAHTWYDFQSTDISDLIINDQNYDYPYDMVPDNLCSTIYTNPCNSQVVNIPACSSLTPIYFEHMDPNVVDNQPTVGTQYPISRAEIAAIKMRHQCENDCENRRDEFRRKVVKMFLDRCYVIGGCRLDDNSNIVPEEDIETIVDELILQCQGQCTITTYVCQDIGCRDILTPPTQLGNTSSTTDFELGAGGDDGVNTDCCPSVIPPYSLSECLTLCGTNPLTYGEYTKWLQARTWDFDLDIVSKCNHIPLNQTTGLPILDGNGDPVTVVYDPNGSDGPYVLICDPGTTTTGSCTIYNENCTWRWVVQGFDYNNCDPNANVAVPKSCYDVPTNVIADGHNPKPGDAVISPKKGIHVQAP